VTPALRLLLGAFGDPGHAFPMLALGRALARRGHEVTLETWRRWREHVEAQGMRFAAAPEYRPFPTPAHALTPYEAVARATLETRPLVAALRPHPLVADVLTLAPSLAAELEGVPVATLIPHLDPRTLPGDPPYSIGARPPRSPAGRALWRSTRRLVDHGLETGRRELDATRERVGLPPLAGVHGGISRSLCLVGTFPQLERARPRQPGTHVVGPLLWEPPAPEVDLPAGQDPLVLVAPSTSQDPERTLLRAALAGLADEPVRVLAIGDPAQPAPPNARLTAWLPYARTMPRCDLVVCHAGHGTLARALASGCAVVAVPAGGDMYENAARVDWAGAGIRLPRRLTTAPAVRLAVRRALARADLRARAQVLARWAAEHDGAERAADLVEALAQAWGGGENSGRRVTRP
jgi:UDP:flavonoid glycosyltransferase YjiC (YdhE family)